MVKDRLSQPDSLEKGWLLDGYPRSLSQATALKSFGFQPDLFILLEVMTLSSCFWYIHHFVRREDMNSLLILYIIYILFSI